MKGENGSSALMVRLLALFPSNIHTEHLPPAARSPPFTPQPQLYGVFLLLHRCLLPNTCNQRCAGVQMNFYPNTVTIFRAACPNDKRCFSSDYVRLLGCIYLALKWASFIIFALCLIASAAWHQKGRISIVKDKP